MNPELEPFIWLTLSRTAIIVLTALLGWITYRSHLLLQEFEPDFNMLLAWPEQMIRLLLIGICALLIWLSGLPQARFGLVFELPLSMIGWGLGIGLIATVLINLVAYWSIQRFGRQIYSPLVLKNILPRRPVEWPLVIAALLPAVVMEELLFRSLWLGGFGGIIPLPALIILTSIVFGLMHQPQGRLGVIIAGILNVLLGLLFVWSNQLLLPLTTHYTINLLQLISARFQRDLLENYELQSSSDFRK